MKLDSRHILILLGLALALSSCVQFSGQEGMAQLYPPVFEVDATVEDLAQTKAEPAKPVPVAPTYPEVHFTVKDKDGTVVYDKLGVWDDPLKLPIGAYSIEAYSGSNTFGSAYFTGTASGTVEGGKEETPKIKMTLQNAYLAVGLTETLAPHFTATGNSIRISTASASIDTGLDTYVFVPSGQPLSIAISGTSSAGVAKTITHSLAARTAATATYLSCDMTTTNAPAITLSGTTEAWGSVGYLTVSNISFDNISTDNQSMLQYNAYEVKTGAKTTGAINGSEIKFTGLTPGETYNVYAEIGALKSGAVSMSVVKPEITISTKAHHTMNTSSELDGTDFTASINIPEKFKSITTVALTLYSSDKAIRSTSLSSGATKWTSDGSEHPKWPYLPKGDYSITGTVTQNDTEINLSKQTMTVPAPTFSIISQPTIYTSYSIYTSTGAIDNITPGASGANGLDGSSIYIRRGTVSIADAIHSNDNYSGIIRYNYISGSKVLKEGQNTGMDWSAHTVSSSVTFDGVTMNFNNTTCHVTGLPYTANPPTNKGNHPWTQDQENWGVEYFKWESSEFCMYVDNATGSTVIIGSPRFSIINDTPVVITVSAKGSRSFKGKIISGSTSSTIGLGTSYESYQMNATFSNSNNKVQIENTKLTAYYKMYINSVSIDYYTK